MEQKLQNTGLFTVEKKNNPVIQRTIPLKRADICKEFAWTCGRLKLGIFHGACAILPSLIAFAILFIVSAPFIITLTTYVIPRANIGIASLSNTTKSISEQGVILNNALAGPSNTIVDLWVPLAPSYNELLDQIGILIEKIKNAPQPATLSETEEDIGVAASQDNVFTFLSLWTEWGALNWDVIVDVWDGLKTLFEVTNTVVGAFVCPTGWCDDKSICPKNSPVPCRYNAGVLSRLITNTIRWIFVRVIWVAKMLLYFAIDFLKVFTALITSIKPAGTWAVLQTPRSPTMLASAEAPYTEIQVLKTILKTIEDVVFNTIFFAIRFIRFLIISFDTIICNIFGDFKHCAVMKTCYTLTRAQVAGCDATGKICISIFLDFSQICFQMGLYRSSCQACDTAIYTDELGMLFKGFSDASAYGCIAIANDPIINNMYNCPLFTWDKNTPTYIGTIASKCVCTGEPFNAEYIGSPPNIVANPFHSPKTMWVVCIPEQKQCGKNSIIPFLFNMAGGFGSPKAA